MGNAIITKLFQWSMLGLLSIVFVFFLFYQLAFVCSLNVKMEGLPHMELMHYLLTPIKIYPKITSNLCSYIDEQIYPIAGL